MFVAWIVFEKVILSCLNLKPDDGFLPYNVPEFFNKTGHGLTDLPEMNLSQLCTQSIFGNNGTYIYCVLEGN